MHHERIHQLVVHAHARVQRRGRILEHHRDHAADETALRSRALRHVLALEEHLARRGLLQTAHHVGRGGLAAAGFAHDAQGFAGHELEGEAAHGLHLVRMQDGARARFERHSDVVEEDDGGGFARSRCGLDARVHAFLLAHMMAPPGTYGLMPRRLSSLSGSSA